MIDFRDEMLGEIAGKIEAALGDLGILRKENGMQPAEERVNLDAEQVEMLAKKIEKLNGMRQFVRDNAPVWPFNAGSLRRFSDSLSSRLFPGSHIFPGNQSIA